MAQEFFHLGRLIGVDEIFGLLLFSLLGVVSITLIGRKERREVATALTLVVLLGFGALCLSMTSQYSSEVYALLFGQVLGVGNSEIVPALAIGVVVISLTAVWFRPLLISSISAELAQARGVSSARTEFWFLTLVALSTAADLPVVGALLVFSLMVGPAALARTITDRPFLAMISSAALAVVLVWVAIALSYQTDWPIGFFVGVFAAIAYVVGHLWKPLSLAAGWRLRGAAAHRAGH